MLEHLMMSPYYNNKILRGEVMDAFTSKRAYDYVFGSGVPMPKSSWNTLDFEPGAGPFAYNSEQDKNADYLTYNYLT